MSRFRFTDVIVGAKYHVGAAEALLTMRDDVQVTLVREPSNEHDTNAVKVVYGDQVLGFLPRPRNKELAAEMDRRGIKQITARFNQHPRSPSISLELG